MRSWTVVVPIRAGQEAKTRLHAPAGLAEAMARDCLQAIRECPDVHRVLVVSSGPVAPPVQDGQAVEMVVQAPEFFGLRGAIRQGLALSTGATAVLLADLPCLLPAALSDGLRSAPHQGPFHVPDADEHGTVLLGADDPDGLPVRFGPASAGEHRAAGSLELPGQSPRLRRDVDTPADLWQAWQLGVGAHTRDTLTAMQVTVLHYDPTIGGDVVTDDGLKVPLPTTALDGSGLRLLRPGQRLTALTATDGDDLRVIAVRINGIGDPLPEQE